MAGYIPFPIYDMKGGLRLDKEPWLLPGDAFSSLSNGYIYHGILKKRRGYSLFGRIVHRITNEVIATGNGGTSYSGTLLNTPLRWTSSTIPVFQDEDGNEHFYDSDGSGTLVGDAGGSGTYNRITGAWTLTFNSAVTSGKKIYCTYDYYPQLPVMGFCTYTQLDGTDTLLVMDTKRLNKYNSSTSQFDDISATDIWTGTATDFFHCVTWNDVIYFTNNVDQIHKYDGSSLSLFVADIDGDSSNDVDTCRLLFYYKERLVMLNTTENSTHHPQRARWCKAGDPTDWTNDGYADAPTSDWIVGAAFLRDDLIVFFDNSIWALKYTGNSTLPFRWVKITDQKGCYASHSVVPFEQEIIALSSTGLISTDGIHTYVIDQKIPDFILNFDSTYASSSYANRLDALRQLWLAYPEEGQTSSNRILVLNYNDKTWSIYTLSATALGTWSREEAITWESETITWESSISWSDESLQAGFPTLLSGNSTGCVYQLNDTYADNSSSITFTAESGRWNPFVDKGAQARLGWIDFLVTRDDDAIITVKFFINHEYSPYQTLTFTCDGNTDKVWKRLHSGAVGNHHHIIIEQTGSSEVVEIHAIVPYFKPAGRTV